jgi:hypothetical protein
MSVNDPFLFGLNMIELFALPAMLAMFVVAVWYGVVRGADGSPVLWGDARRRAAARARRSPGAKAPAKEAAPV